MKIEKISDNQVKFVLNKADLVEKDIKITELAYGSEKTQDLFREMMEKAYDQCGFEAENTPLMIEAIPVAVDSIMIIVTKVSSSEDIESKFNLLPKTREHNKFPRRENPYERYSRPVKTNIYIYSFKQMDDAINLSSRLFDSFNGESSMYKYNGEYFMVFDNQLSAQSYRTFEAVLNEYGQKYISGVITKYHLMEHGEIIIPEEAVQILAKI
ncbi:MAG: adaptor protein MecA [Defluviitaleaceae bacterium]|nr:adaptor protein MecA [Defluviitaleaceae bacterium]